MIEMQPWRRRREGREGEGEREREKEKERERERGRDHREATARLDLLLQRSRQKFEFGGMEINKRHLLSNSADKWSIEQEIWSSQINDPV